MNRIIFIECNIEIRGLYERNILERLKNPGLALDLLNSNDPEILILIVTN